MQRRVDRPDRGDSERDSVHARGRYIHRVVEPLAGVVPAEIVAAADIGSHFQVDAVGPIAVCRAVYRGDVECDALTAGIIILRLHRAGNRGGCAPERGGGLMWRESKGNRRTGVGGRLWA